MFTRLCISSGILHSWLWICSFPLSIRLISRISLISPNRWLLEERIFCRQSLTWSVRSIWLAAIVAKPIIAFIGVRISWLILDRKVVFAWFAFCACIKASCKACVCSRCLLTCSVMSRDTTMAIRSPVSSSEVMIKDWRTHMGSHLSAPPQ